MPYPTAANTGVPSGTTLTPSGDIIVTRAGTVLNGLDIKGMVIIRADNVTVQNSKISSDAYAGVKVESGFKGASVINSDIDGMGSTANSFGIMGNGTFVGNDIRGFENGINLTGGSSTIRGNYIHGLKAPDSPHYDGIQIQGGQNGVLIENNTIIVDADQTGAIFMQNFFGSVNDVTVRNNYVDGGGYTMYYDGSKPNGYTMTDVVWEDNYNGGGYWGHEFIKADPRGNLPTRSGNVNTDNPLSPEQASGGSAPAPAPEPIEPTPTEPSVPAPPTEGTDSVESSVSYTLAENVENLKLTGAADINGTGNALNNFLDGNDGKNVLRGGDGADILNGRYDGDTLWGDAGRDTFQFTSKWSANGDKVMDFVRGTDRLDFSGIDANAAAAGNQAFAWAGYKSAGGTGSNGQIWAVKDAAAGETHLYIKTGGSVVTVDVAGTGYTLSSADLIL
ncbi:right-handed parallel beta-helix repeat-containing protein [Microvirga sp. 0TCS3.31]